MLKFTIDEELNYMVYVRAAMVLWKSAGLVNQGSQVESTASQICRDETLSIGLVSI